MVSLFKGFSHLGRISARASLLALVGAGCGTVSETGDKNPIAEPAAAGAPAQVCGEEAFRAIQSLNYITVSVCSIAAYRDRIVLDQEQDKVINNLDLSQIRDEQLIDSYQHLMSLLKTQALSDSQRRRVEWKYERQVENALYDALSQSVSGGRRHLLGGTNPYMAILGVAQQAGGAYFSYRTNLRRFQDGLEEDIWKLSDDSYWNLMDFRSEFLKDSWTIMHRVYGNSIPESYRLTEGQIGSYLDILKDGNQARRFRRLCEIRDNFAAYPPFWYYLGQDAQGLGMTNIALACYGRFESVRRPIHRRDMFYPSVCMNRVALRLQAPDKWKQEIAADLRVIEEHAPDSWEKMAFAAACYLKIRKPEEARRVLTATLDRLEAAVDWGNENAAPEPESKTKPRVQPPPVSPAALTVVRGLLADTCSQARDYGRLDALVKDIVSGSAGQYRDALYLVGKTDDPHKLNAIRDAILSIALSPSVKWGRKDQLELFVPVRFYYQNVDIACNLRNSDRLGATLNLDGDEPAAAAVAYDRKRNGIVFVFRAEIGDATRARVSIRHAFCDLGLEYRLNGKKWELSGVDFYGRWYELKGGSFERASSPQ